MADRMSNIASLFKEGKTRAIVLTTLVVLLIAITVGFFALRGRTKGVEASAGLQQAPVGIQSNPFNAPNEEYARAQEKQNVEQAKIAEQRGGSAIPTIIRSSNEPPPPTEEETGGLGFTGLSREQSNTGTFSPKKFTADAQKKGEAVICPTVEPAAAPLGTPVYDENGKLIGYAGADGKVRDANGNIIGTLGSDGLVHDLNGKVIGQKSAVITGTPVYDEQGNLIGYVGADGKVRDATGRIVGVVGADGVVRDAAGNVIGHTGKPVYDANGKLLGFAGADGKIRDAEGNIIGTVGPDGIARNMNGNIMGRAGAISPGTPVYDANGNIIGYVGPDGKVRDANGNVIGTVGVDGQIRDARGNLVGSISKPAISSPAVTKAATGAPGYGADKTAGALTPEPPASQNSEAASYARQQEILKDQRLQQLIQQKQQAMSTQASQLLTAWTSPVQQYVEGQRNESASSNEKNEENTSSETGSATASTPSAGNKSGPVLIKAGTVYYGIINTAVNSDEPGPVMAEIINGEFKGGKLLGSLTNQGTAVLINFNILTLPQFPKSISVNVVAIDQNTARTALSTYTDKHYLLRFGSLFAASFAQGYATALTTSGTTTTPTIFGQVVTRPNLSGTDKFYMALGNIGTQFSNQMNSIYSTPPTVHVAAGTAVGMLFLGDVQMPTA